MVARFVTPPPGLVCPAALESPTLHPSSGPPQRQGPCIIKGYPGRCLEATNRSLRGRAQSAEMGPSKFPRGNGGVPRHPRRGPEHGLRCRRDLRKPMRRMPFRRGERRPGQEKGRALPGVCRSADWPTFVCCAPDLPLALICPEEGQSCKDRGGSGGQGMACFSPRAEAPTAGTRAEGLNPRPLLTGRSNASNWRPLAEWL